MIHFDYSCDYPGCKTTAHDEDPDSPTWTDGAVVGVESDFHPLPEGWLADGGLTGRRHIFCPEHASEARANE